MSYKHEIKVIFEDGDFLYTTINGSKEDVRAYYIGKFFNCGTVEDNMKKCVDVKFLNWEGVLYEKSDGIFYRPKNW